jgi:Tfp pilus assembly protein PilV
MTMQLPTRRRTGSSSANQWSGASFVVESLVLLFFLVASLAVVMQLFSSSVKRGEQGETLSQAVVLASNKAEQFSADPTSAAGHSQEDDYIVDCAVTPETTSAGILYHASITVSKNGSEVYSVETSRYASGVTR